jgi:hypothetical protein
MSTTEASQPDTFHVLLHGHRLGLAADLPSVAISFDHDFDHPIPTNFSIRQLSDAPFFHQDLDFYLIGSPSQPTQVTDQRLNSVRNDILDKASDQGISRDRASRANLVCYIQRAAACEDCAPWWVASFK